MINNINQKIDEWSKKFNDKKTEKDLQIIFAEMCDLCDEAEIAQVEKIVLLINQCIILDALKTETYKKGDRIYTRSDIVEEIKIFYEEFIQSSVIDEWENDSSLAFKEHISYLVALILYKVHKYMEAYEYFVASREFSARLDNAENANGLDLLCRIKRDIHFAYCCEYIGTPMMQYERLVESLKILLGTKEGIGDEDQYWNQLKSYSYANIDILESFFSSSENIEKKAGGIINVLLGFSEDEKSVFSRLKNMQSRGKNVDNEYNEAVHVLAHCINELNMGLIVGGNDSKEAMENYKIRNLMKMIVCINIDSLGERYATCQATIRAEQGNGIDAISRMHEISKEALKEQDQAELDFYQYYFESMFPHQDDEGEHKRGEADKKIDKHGEADEKVHKHGEMFREYCEKNYDTNTDNFQDGLLHYHVVSLRRQLKLFLEGIVNSTNQNEFFFQDDKKIYKSGCFECYEELRKKEFSEFVNVQMTREREKLIIVYKILRNLQNSKLPLFYEGENFNENLIIDERIKELYNLCKKFSELQERIGGSYYFDERSKKCFNYDDGKSSEYSEIANNIVDGVPVCVEGLTFELYGNINKFKNFFEKYSFAYYEMLEGESFDKNSLNLKSKVLCFDDAERCSDCCEELCSKPENKNIRIFYVGEPDDNWEYKTIAAFKSVNICFLMAYIYESIESIIDYIFHPTPIYILAPLRNVSNYEFQEAKFDSLLKFPDNFIEPIEVSSAGIGIRYYKENVKDDYFHISFLNDDIRRACIGLIKLYEDKLYVKRGERLVYKEAVHIGLVNKMYDDYAAARKVAENKRHKECVGGSHRSQKCSYFYKSIEDDEKFSRRRQEAVKKLRYLFYIACEEHVILTDKCYLLQLSFTTQERLDDGGFEICIFDKDITRFFSEECCLREVVSIIKEESEKKKDDKSGSLAEDDNMRRENDIDKRDKLVKKLLKFITDCESVKESCEINNNERSLPRVEELLNAAQKNLRYMQGEDTVNYEEVEIQWKKWSIKLKEIVG